MLTDKTIDLAQALILLPSITPDDAGCQDLISTRLAAMGFNIQHLPYGSVRNLWAKRGNTTPLLVFVGHTDVVPVGQRQDWLFDPFGGVIQDGFLHGRGSADMKGALAAMVVACERFLNQCPDHVGSIAFLLTSDEEGPAQDGTRQVVEYLKTQQEQITWCVVGEPSCEYQLGDTIKIGRRGSLNARLTVDGQQGHIAYPHLANNPIHLVLPALMELCQSIWDKGDAFFPATCLQISNIHAGTGVTNVIPGNIETLFNFRYSPVLSVESIKAKVSELLKKHDFRYQLDWTLSGEPFLTSSGTLLAATQTIIQRLTGLTPQLSTGGGTSDGRFLAPLGCDVLELGLCHSTIHQVNECVKVSDLIQLTSLYEALLCELFSTKKRPD